MVTPALPTRFEWLASATDKAREQADERLRAVLAQIGELGTEASGNFGPTIRFWRSRMLSPRSRLTTSSLGCARRSAPIGRNADCSTNCSADWGLPVTVFSLPE